MRDAQKRLDETSGRIDAIKRELAGIDGSLAKLKGEARDGAAAHSRLPILLRRAPRRCRRSIRHACCPSSRRRAWAFRQKPDGAGLKAVQEQCTQLLKAMTSAPTTKERVAGIDCDPKRAQEAASLLLALDSGSQVFAAKLRGRREAQRQQVG